MAKRNQSLIDNVMDRLRMLRHNHTKYALTSDVINSTLSLDFTTIRLPKECKIVKVYYAGETIAAYRKMIEFYHKIIDDKTMNIRTEFDRLETAIVGWKALKEVTETDIMMMHRGIGVKRHKVDAAHEKLNTLIADFDAKNNDLDGMIDHFTIPLYRYVRELQYRKIFMHFFKRDRIHDMVIYEHLRVNTEMLDRLIELLNMLYDGWDKTGKGDEFERYRTVQRQLIDIVQKFANLVEADSLLYERFNEVAETVINFKVYPVK